MLTCSLMQLYVYGQTDLINDNVNKIALSAIAELITFIPKFNMVRVYVMREIKLHKFNYMGRLLLLAGGYSCSWMVTNDPGVTLPPHRGRVSGTQGQRWWVPLLLGTAGPPTPGQERPSNGRPDASQRRPGSMLCPVGLPGALSVDILALLLYWPTYAPITVRLTSDTHRLPTDNGGQSYHWTCELRPLKNIFYMVFLSCYSSALL